MVCVDSVEHYISDIADLDLIVVDLKYVVVDMCGGDHADI